MEIKEWQKGNDCTLSVRERIELHDIWLKDMKEEIRRELIPKSEETNEQQPIGFIDID